MSYIIKNQDLNSSGQQQIINTPLNDRKNSIVSAKAQGHVIKKGHFSKDCKYQYIIHIFIH